MRYFLIDKVTEIIVGQNIRGVKNITLSDEILHDHFPDFPIMPGVLILESVAQLAGFLLEVTFNDPGISPLRALLMKIDVAKFHQSCGPGDQLDISVSIDSMLDTAAKIKAEVLNGDQRAVTTTMTFAMKKIDSERIHEQRKYIYKLWTKDLQPPLSNL
ncbi:MAG: 3-hydroxyacyl-ACP dehydratase FabZ family protein [Candidatus Neomarinimicrobiota bacterium]